MTAETGMAWFHVVSDIPKKAGDRIVLDGTHPNGVHRRVYEQIGTVEEILRDPEACRGMELSHEVRVALRELAMEKVRKDGYPQYPSRMASLYVSRTFREAEQWAEYFAGLGRPTYAIAKIEAAGRCFFGDAGKCFDGSVSEEENLRKAEIYWKNGPNEDGREPIREILVDGEIRFLEIVKEINANVR